MNLSVEYVFVFFFFSYFVGILSIIPCFVLSVGLCVLIINMAVGG